MITLQMQLWPYGSSALRTPLISARIWTDRAPDTGAPIHRYVIYDADDRVIARGQVPKDRSGHRNPLWLLHRILAAIDVDALPNDHLEAVWGRPPGGEASAAAVQDGIDQAKQSILDCLGVLKEAGPEGQAALAAIAADLDLLAGNGGGAIGPEPTQDTTSEIPACRHQERPEGSDVADEAASDPRQEPDLE